jgi:hypothetical protein
MKRSGILTAGGDPSALDIAIPGAAARANQLKVEIVGTIRGFNCFSKPPKPHVHLNPLYRRFPRAMLSTATDAFCCRQRGAALSFGQHDRRAETHILR